MIDTTIWVHSWWYQKAILDVLIVSLPISWKPHTSKMQTSLSSIVKKCIKAFKTMQQFLPQSSKAGFFFIQDLLASKTTPLATPSALSADHGVLWTQRIGWREAFGTLWTHSAHGPGAVRLRAPSFWKNPSEAV